MRVGVNYTPRIGWFHSWLDLDVDDIRADFEAIAGLGLDHVRIFPLWPLLQPNRGLIRASAVDDVVRVADVAAEFGLDVSVDALNGHLSSYDFLPSWVVTWHRRNLFTDPSVLAGQAQLVGALARALRGHPAVRGMTLGNEFAQFAAPDEPHRHPMISEATSADADRWLGSLFAVLDGHWPGGRHVHGFDDDVWFVDRHPFTPRHATTFGAETTVHSWIFAQVGPRFGSGHPALTAFARYLLELARAWSPDPGRPVWLQEVGIPRSHVSDGEAERFMTGLLDAVVDAPGLSAVTWWCSHDVDRSLLDFPELEYSLGLFDQAGRPKPEASALAERIPELRASGETGTSAEAATSGQVAFAADWATGAGRSVTGPAGPVFAEWLERFVAGERPSLVRRDP